MPIYEYRCTKGHTFDVMQRMSDDPVLTCEACGGPVQRVLHAPAVHFKGSGFYNTDYGTRKRSREAKESGEGSNDGSAATSTAGSDSKSDGASSAADAKKPAEKATAASS
jgi:putative FmdB family regulatory protein